MATPTQRVRSTWPWYLAMLLIAGLAAGIISAQFLAESLAALGIPDPGMLTTFGLPFFRAAAWILVALAVGSYLLTAFLIPPRMPEPAPDAPTHNSGLAQARLSVDGHLAARTGALSLLAVAAVALVMVSMTFSDVSGTPFFSTFAHWNVALDQVAEAKSWLIMSLLAAAVGIVGLFARRWTMQPILLIGAVLTVVPLGMEGHSASGGDHDWGTNSYLWHLVFMVLWIGGLTALIAHSRRLGDHLALAVRRYSSLALFAAAVMAISGVVNAALRIGPHHLFTTNYGWIITAKTVLTLVLVGLGWLHRQRSIPQLAQRPGVFRRIAIVEVLVMALTAGIAVTMGRTPPPAPDDPNLSTMEITVGYDIPFEPDILNVWTVWRFDVMFSALGILLAAGYLYAVRRARRAGHEWSRGRTAWFLLGSLGMAVIMSSGVGMIIPATFSMHMIGHMLLSMTFPVFLVLGAPLTLIMTAWEPGEAGKPNLHDWTRAFCQSRGLSIITYPPINLAQFIFVFYALYLNFDWYQAAISDHAGHVIMNWAFLVSGYIYFWEVMGPDPLPGRKQPLVRLAWLFFSMPIHLYLGVYMMQLTEIYGEEFYTSINLPWAIDLLADQRVGAGIGWAAGSFPLIVVFGELFRQLFTYDREQQEAIDAEMDRVPDHDLTDDLVNDGPADDDLADDGLADDDRLAAQKTVGVQQSVKTPKKDSELSNDSGNALDLYNAMLEKMSRGEHIEDEYHESEMGQSRFRRKRGGNGSGWGNAPE
ncbi:cytochrome c oxidase assembly protein [Corynebacterium propinquum]|uniref:cytochrome c oxidase assembly protein n=1 Tax=Corynebacterium propinquum TaxID=43769 RepID=UPI0025439C6A|nr:cytochrome c oxidase assembly protein [Corynebacterium propinquum]MDK4252631.1 cytochrome c oxidase assembly protein [Corynebacterium propinquum]